MKILIVDDNTVDQMIAEKILSSYGKCYTTSNGFQTTDVLAQAQNAGEPFDLVFLDIMMPDLDGQEVLRNIRAMDARQGIWGDRGMKVIMVTALDDSENLMMALNENCEAYLVKPLNKKKIEALMRDLALKDN